MKNLKTNLLPINIVSNLIGLGGETSIVAIRLKSVGKEKEISFLTLNLAKVKNLRN